MTRNSGIETSKIRDNKKTICSLSLILILAVSMLMAFAQPTFAQIGSVPQPVKTVGYIDIAPHLIGVGQTASVNLWIYPLPNTILGGPYYGGFNGITVTFTKPDGTKDTFMPVSGAAYHYAAGQTETLGTLISFYAPDMAGNWSLSFTMPAQNITISAGTVQYQGCTSNTVYFTVQTYHVNAGLLDGYPWSPLPNPNVFWSYPINSNNREWYQISGDWLQGGMGHSVAGLSFWGVTARQWQPYGTGPNTGHIVWKNQLKPGGLIGGDLGSLSYDTVLDNAAVPYGIVIMDGRVFVKIPNNDLPDSGNTFECIDLTSGKVLYTANGGWTKGIHLPGNELAQTAYYDPSINIQASWGNAYTSRLLNLGSTWDYYNIFNGARVRSIVNASSSYRFIDGTNLAYRTAGGNLTAWDMRQVVNNNFPTGITWTTRLPSSSASLFAFSNDLSIIVVMYRNEYWGLSATDGTTRWHTTTPPLAASEATHLYGVNKWIVWDKVSSTFSCYSILTGALLWTSDSAVSGDSPWASAWTRYNSLANDNDNMYTNLPDGTIVALSLATGKEAWRSTAFPSTEYTNNVVPYYCNIVLVGGNVYADAGYSTEYMLNPIPRHGMLVCINATTGDITFTLNGGVVPIAAADGYVIGLGTYDGNYYCLGKGPTKTTVTAPLTAVPAGTGVLIQGSVMDMSPASQDYAVQVRFPNGVPAVADVDMSELMDYLYMQNATLLNSPPIPHGVTVSVSALDSNGAYTDLGTTTSNYAGQFALSWKPTTEGTYQIFASFAGSDSYYGSYAGTALSVGEAPQAPTDGGGPTTEPVDNTMTIIGVGVVLAIIMAIVGVLLYRKK